MLTVDVVENILFNLPYVEERYQRTLEVCALVNDLKILEDGDGSEIGERGVHAPSFLCETLLTCFIGESVWRTESTR
jgi:hypothetical protein